MAEQKIRDIMTTDPVSLPAETTIVDAARRMQEEDIGDVIVTEDGDVRGIVTDRDIAIRVVAEERPPAETTLSEIASERLVTLSPDDSVIDAVELMREHAVRRLPIVENGEAVGIVAIGDLAVEREPDSALADISAADPNE